MTFHKHINMKLHTYLHTTLTLFHTHNNVEMLTYIRTRQRLVTNTSTWNWSTLWNLHMTKWLITLSLRSAHCGTGRHMTEPAHEVIDFSQTRQHELGQHCGMQRKNKTRYASEILSFLQNCGWGGSSGLVFLHVFCVCLCVCVCVRACVREYDVCVYVCACERERGRERRERERELVWVSVRGTFRVRHLKMFDYFSVSYFTVNHKLIKDTIKGN